MERERVTIAAPAAASVFFFKFSFALGLRRVGRIVFWVDKHFLSTTDLCLIENKKNLKIC